GSVVLGRGFDFRRSDAMKRLVVLLLLPLAMRAACTLSLRSPANNSVVTYGTALAVTWSGCTTTPSSVRYYFDHRLEAVSNAAPFSASIVYQTYSDYKAAQVYAEAYDAAGRLIATSPADTFRIDNGGVNAGSTFTDGAAAKVRGDTITTGKL